MMTYEHFEDVNLVNEGGVVLDLFLLDCLDGKLLSTFTMLCQVYDTEAAICELLLERINFLDVALGRIDEVLRLVG